MSSVSSVSRLIVTVVSLCQCVSVTVVVGISTYPFRLERCPTVDRPNERKLDRRKKEEGTKEMEDKEQM